MALKKYIFGKGNPEPNTFIGGVSATLDTPALIAAKLGININRIKSFKIAGSDIEFAVVGGAYVLPNSSFLNTPVSFFLDNDGLITDVGSTSFKANPISAGRIYLPGIISLTGQSVYQDSYGFSLTDFPNCVNFPKDFFGNWSGNGKTLSIPKATNIGGTVGNDLAFRGPNVNGLTIITNSLNQTSNGGGVEGDLAFAISGGATVVYV